MTLTWRTVCKTHGVEVSEGWWWFVRNWLRHYFWEHLFGRESP